MNDFLIYHNILGGEQKAAGGERTPREMARKLAKMQSIADTTDRNFEAENVYYDLFDGTNDHSIGEIDLLKFNILRNTSRLIYLEDATVTNSLYPGMELTIVKDKKIERVNIETIEDKFFSITTNIESGAFDNSIAYRSMVELQDGKLSLIPSYLSEHDIRYNIVSPSTKPSKLYTWIKYDNPSVCSSFEAVVERVEENLTHYEGISISSTSIDRPNFNAIINYVIPSMVVKTSLYINKNGILPTPNNYEEVQEIIGSGSKTATINMNSLDEKIRFLFVTEYSDGTLNDTNSQCGKIEIPNAIRYEFKVNKNIEVPSLMIETYGQSDEVFDWDTVFPFNEIKPVAFNKESGAKIGNVKIEDFSKMEDGTAVLNTSEVFIHFPKIYWNVTEDNDYIYFKISNIKLTRELECYAHKLSNVEKDSLYIGAYQSSGNSSGLYSQTGVSFLHSQYPANFRAYAAKKNKYLLNYHCLNMIRILYMMRYKNLDSQRTIGRGMNNTYTPGVGDKLGMTSNLESSSSKIHCAKLFGLENLYGNGPMFVDGISFVNGKAYINRNADGCNNEATGYDSYALNYNSTSGKLKSINGSGSTVFLPASLENITSDKYYSDHCYMPSKTSSSMCCLHMHYTSSSNSSVYDNGLFGVNASNGITNSVSYSHCRLIKFN